MKIKELNLDEIRCYIDVVPVIINAKYNDLTKERCERCFDRPFLVVNALDLVEKYVLPSIGPKRTEIQVLLDIMKNHKNQGLILRGYKDIQYRKYTSAYLLHLLKKEFGIIILDDAEAIEDFPHDGGAVFIDHWKEA